MTNCPNWIIQWVNAKPQRKIPWLVKWLWPNVHFCSDNEGMAVAKDSDCDCNVLLWVDGLGETHRGYRLYNPNDRTVKRPTCLILIHDSGINDIWEIESLVHIPTIVAKCYIGREVLVKRVTVRELYQ